jgi:hypothetical protein
MSSSRHFAPSVVVSQSDRFKSSCRFPTCSPARDLQCTFSCAKCWLSFKSVVARDWGAKTLEVTWFGKKIVLKIVFVSEGNRQEMRDAMVVLWFKGRMRASISGEDCVDGKKERWGRHPL